MERLRREGETFMQELSREFYASLSGMKATAELQQIYLRHRAIMSEDSLELAREAFFDSAVGSDARRSARVLLEWQTESQSSRQLAPLDEREIAWEGDAVVHISDSRAIPYQRTSIELGNSTDRAERAAIEKARGERTVRQALEAGMSAQAAFKKFGIL